PLAASRSPAPVPATSTRRHLRGSRRKVTQTLLFAIPNWGDWELIHCFSMGRRVVRWQAANALDVVYVPATFDSSAACMMRAQAYVANSSIGRDLQKNEAFKVICVRGSINRVDKADSGPSNWAR